jgi:hypothetical protein
LTLSSTDEAEDSNVSPERIAQLAKDLALKMHETVDEINHVNRTTRLLAINAKIEAARAGTVGAAFSVVAGEIGVLAERTTVSTKAMTVETQAAISELETISQTLSTKVRGTRLSDLALTNIDLIDRNLYERSCDVRWWATDSSAVDACIDKTREAYKYASERFRVILSSYTVYYDLVLCDLDGNVVANGRPDLYRSQGMNCRDAVWFQEAMKTRSSEEFGFEGVHKSQLVNGERVLAYSCCVRGRREHGELAGKPVGVLGILFNWDALAQTIVHATPLPAAEKPLTRVCIVDSKGLIIADTAGQQLEANLDLPRRDELFRSKKTAVMEQMRGKQYCIAHAKSPGYETYATGWHSVIVQQIESTR